jgi:hypothetical protein
MAGAAPILIGGTFTPTWHVPSCPCDSCIATRKTLDGLGEFLKELEKDPAKKAEWQAKVHARLDKHRRTKPVKLQPRNCDCCHCRRY